MTVMTMTMCSSNTPGPTGSTMTTTDTSTPTTSSTSAGGGNTAAAATGDEARTPSLSPPSCSSSSGGPLPTSVAETTTSPNNASNSASVKVNVKYRGEEGRKAVLSACREVLYDYGVLCSVVIVELNSAADVEVLSAHPDVAWVDVDAQISFIAPMNTALR